VNGDSGFQPLSLFLGSISYRANAGPLMSPKGSLIVGFFSFYLEYPPFPWRVVREFPEKLLGRIYPEG